MLSRSVLGSKMGCILGFSIPYKKTEKKDQSQTVGAFLQYCF